MINPQTEAAELAHLRGHVYRLLSQCFFHANKDMVTSIKNGSLVQVLKMTLGTMGDVRVDQAIELLEGFSGKCYECSLADVSSELNIEYNRLFVGPGHLPSPPYESIYLTKNEENKDGLVMGDSTLDAKNQYLSAGITLSEDFTDLPDHIGVELDFMSWLCFQESSKLENEEYEGVTEIVNKQFDFLTNHLDNWITPFTHAIIHSTNLDFYKGLARMTECWIQYEKKSFTHNAEDALLI